MLFHFIHSFIYLFIDLLFEPTVPLTIPCVHHTMVSAVYKQFTTKDTFGFQSQSKQKKLLNAMLGSPVM